MEPRDAGEWFHWKVLNILWGHFYGLWERRPWKIAVDLFFTITFIFFYEKQKTKQPALRDMLRHFHGLHSHRPYLSTNQRLRIRLVIVKYKVLLFINTTCQSVAIVAVTICMTSSLSLRGRLMQKNIHLHLS